MENSHEWFTRRISSIPFSDSVLFIEITFVMASQMWIFWQILWIIQLLQTMFVIFIGTGDKPQKWICVLKTQTSSFWEKKFLFVNYISYIDFQNVC